MSVLDKVFKAYDIRGLYGQQIDEDMAWRIGYASARFLHGQMTGSERGLPMSNRIVVGRDMRPHSEPLAKALIEGITASGTGCIDIGMCDTPMVYFGINHLGTCGGIMVTASHNPIEYNGFKISGPHAKPVGSESGLTAIRDTAAAVTRTPGGASAGAVQAMDLWAEYRRHVAPFLKLPRPLKVVVDASNGMGGRMIPALFSGTALEMIPLNFELGKGFAHPPNPMVEVNLGQLKAAVTKHKADVGICLDGDADRCMFVDEQGRSVRCDLITALLGRGFLADNPGAMVVYDLRSSRVVSEEIRAGGGVPYRCRVGHSFMKKSLADGKAVFGGELSGHFYFRDNFNCDSGAIVFATMMTVLAAQARPLSDLVAPLKRYSHSGEINFEVADKQAKLNEIIAALPGAKVDHLDGVTCQFDDWWCNVRPSNTEPLLRLTLEARDEKSMKEKLALLQAILGKPVDH
ncbi:MAG: phosphomannomutase/phosphoglucomutase [Planctomycetota bacterium]